MKTFSVTAYPYAVQRGEIDIPDDVTDVRDYIERHWSKIRFASAEVYDCDADYGFEEV